MKVAVVGGGIVGLFAARQLDADSVDVTLFEPGDLGEGSVHAAGIIEPSTAYRTNTFDFLRRLVRFWRSGTSTFRTVDPRWLLTTARRFEQDPPGGADRAIEEVSRVSVDTYRSLARATNDFDFREGGLVERFEDPRHFAAERAIAARSAATVPVQVVDSGRAGDLVFPEVGWLHTERCVARLARELGRTRVVRRRVDRVDLDGTVGTAGGTERFDAVVVAAGVACRRLGVPITGVRGYGWHAKVRRTVERATIFVDRGIAVVPFDAEVKVTGGWDFDLSRRPFHVEQVLAAAREVVEIDELLDFKEGSRPTTPDGLPTVGRRGNVVVATGGFRLGWSFAPGLGRHAAQLAEGRTENDPFLARFCRSIRSARL